MVNESEQYQRKLRADSPRQIIGMVVCVVFANVARDAGWLPFVPAFFLAMAAMYIIDYWLPPRPPGSFINWITRVVLLMAYGVGGCWLFPILLKKLVWRPLAYGVPVFLVCMSTKWIPPLYPTQRERTWRATLIFSSLLALGLALAGTFGSGW